MPFIFKKTVEQTRESGNHLLVQLKANHPTLLEAVRSYCTEHSPEDQHYTASSVNARAWNNAPPACGSCPPEPEASPGMTTSKMTDKTMRLGPILVAAENYGKLQSIITEVQKTLKIEVSTLEGIQEIIW